MIKRTIQTIIWSCLAVLFFTACDPYEGSSKSLGKMDLLTDEQVSFTYKPSSKSDNILTFENTTPINGAHSFTWNFGNGTSSNSKSATAQYPEKGDYTVSLTIALADGSQASKSQVITIEQDDFSLIDTEVYNNLTGGGDNTAGKVWVIDRYNNFTSQVNEATGLNITGHMGLGPQGSYSQEWWGAAPNDKDMWTLYDQTFTFVQNGLKLSIQTDGEGYGRKESSSSVGGYDIISTDGDDATFVFEGGDFSFSVDEEGKYPILTLSKPAFMGYYCGSQEYEIIYLTDEVMALRVNNTVEEQDWTFVYCLEELNVEAPEEPKEVKAIPLTEDFEGEDFLDFVYQEMGDRTGISDNPWFTSINNSNKVFRYEKSTSISSNISYVAEDYKFDLSKQNQIKLKVFIPSSNDFTTEHDAEDWTPSKKLLPKIAVKLHDSDHGAPWETQIEQTFELTTNQLDQWVELTFDFSEAADRTDFDKIVIQLGQEGHTGTGIFYLDDFDFSE